MRLGKYWISIRKLWTAFLGVVAYLTSSEIVPVHYRALVQIIGAIVLAFNISPTEHYTPQLFENDALTAAKNVAPLLPTNVETALTELITLIKAGQAGYTTGYLAPGTVAIASGQATLGDDVRAAIASGATLVGTPPPPVVNAAPAPAAQTVGVALVSPPVLPVVYGQSA